MINLGKENSLLNQFIAELRDHEIQQDSLRFRRNMERIGEIFAYEISKKLAYKNLEVVTTLGAAQVPVLEQQVVITSILRSGLPLHNGLLNFFDKAQNGFISAYRKFDKTEKFRVKIEYISAPDINNKVLILA
ncbi:MAG: uracil phosphoribosyltransferase, partial [Bacteroidales bacterium]|nr:uracil phosphoribosyltransferase [Bacteroidales bacterium]